MRRRALHWGRVRAWSHRRLIRVDARESLTSGEPTRPPSCSDRGDTGHPFGDISDTCRRVRRASRGAAVVPFREWSMMSLREEFVLLALQPGANRRELCRRFGIVADTGYRLLARYQAEGLAGLAYRSRRPKRSPRQTSPELETVVLALRAQHRPGADASSPRGCAPSVTPRSRRPRRSPRSCAATAGSTRAVPGSLAPTSASSTTPRTSSGRWTSRDTSPADPGAATR